MKHEGLHTYRLEANPKEKMFAELWEKLQNESFTLEYLLSENNRRVDVDVSEHDKTVAATVIQWLGSPCGQEFLKEASKE